MRLGCALLVAFMLSPAAGQRGGGMRGGGMPGGGGPAGSRPGYPSPMPNPGQRPGSGRPRFRQQLREFLEMEP